MVRKSSFFGGFFLVLLVRLCEYGILMLEIKCDLIPGTAQISLSLDLTLAYSHLAYPYYPTCDMAGVKAQRRGAIVKLILASSAHTSTNSLRSSSARSPPTDQASPSIIPSTYAGPTNRQCDLFRLSAAGKPDPSSRTIASPGLTA